MRTDSTNYCFPHREAQTLSDLAVVLDDMEGVIDLLSPIGNFGQDKFDARLLEARWNCAVVKYMRAFSDGPLRWGKQEALAAMDDNCRQAHERIRSERNQYIAHSINRMEEAMPVVQIAVGDDGSKEIRAVHCSRGRFIAGSEMSIAELRALAEYVRHRVNVAIQAERSRLLELAREIGPDELMKEKSWGFDVSERDARKQREPLAPRPKRR